MKAWISFWIYSFLVVGIMFYLLLHNQETAASLVLVVGGFMMPIMMFLSFWFKPENDKPAKKQKPNKPKGKGLLYGLFILAIASSVALFLMEQKDAAIIMAFILLIIQRVGHV